MVGPLRKSEPTGAQVFATTHWSVVLTAGQSGSEPAQTALETLCRAYWYPIYYYIRRKGVGADDAQDLTQGFFAQIIAKEHLRRADREKGKFRTFLLSILDYFLAREWNRAHRQKRGGRIAFVSLDEQDPEERYKLEPANNETPEKNFLRQWALMTLRQTMNTLEAECQASGKAPLLQEARGILSGEQDTGRYAEIAKSLGVSEGAARVAVHRLRQRYGQLLREQIAQTVSGPEEIEEELRYLLKVLTE